MHAFPARCRSISTAVLQGSPVEAILSVARLGRVATASTNACAAEGSPWGKIGFSDTSSAVKRVVRARCCANVVAATESIAADATLRSLRTGI